MATVNKYEKDKDLIVGAKILANNNATVNPNNTANDMPTLTNASGSGYTVSDTVNQAQGVKSNAASKVYDATNKGQIISNDVYNGINSQFIKPSSVSQADAWLGKQLQSIQSGKTSYSDDVRNLMNQITNREKFTYDVDADPLFQQALASATNSGKLAMQDTIGQASALTGGYGSSYATAVGNQAYNSFIEDAYDQLPQYYQMAREADQMEVENLYRQLEMFTEADERDYNRNMAAYDAIYNLRNRLYDESYGQFRDTKSDWFKKSDLQMQVHNQEVNDAYTNYEVASKEYSNVYNEWLDGINLAWKEKEYNNANEWKQKEFDNTNEWKQKEYDRAVLESDRNYKLNVDQFNYQKSKGTGSGDGGNGKAPTQAMLDKALNLYNSGKVDEAESYIASLQGTYDITPFLDYIGAEGYEWAGEDWAQNYNYLNSFNIYNDIERDKANKLGPDTYVSNINGTEQYLNYEELSRLIYDSNIPYEKRKFLINKYLGQSKK